MRSASPLALVFIGIVLCSPPAIAQLPANNVAVLPLGSYELTETDGSPVKPGYIVGTDITNTPIPGVKAGEVWIEPIGNPAARRIIARESFVMTPHAGGFTGTNASGNTFEMEFNSALGKWETVMTSGPKTGTRRRLNPRP